MLFIAKVTLIGRFIGKKVCVYLSMGISSILKLLLKTSYLFAFKTNHLAPF